VYETELAQAVGQWTSGLSGTAHEAKMGVGNRQWPLDSRCTCLRKAFGFVSLGELQEAAPGERIGALGDAAHAPRQTPVKLMLHDATTPQHQVVAVQYMVVVEVKTARRDVLRRTSLTTSHDTLASAA
jgi:hypothetical protein